MEIGEKAFQNKTATTETDGFGTKPAEPFDHDGVTGCVEDEEMTDDGFVTKSVQIGGNYTV